MFKFTAIFLTLLFTLTNVYAEEVIREVTEPKGKEWELSEAFNYSRGEYGTGSLIQIYELDSTLKRFFERGDISLTVPFISIKADSQVTIVRGFAQRVRTTRTGRETTSGIGDLSLNGSYYLLSEYNNEPLDLDLNGYVKFPTADEGKGLGTGEFDAGPGISFGKRFLEDWRAFADIYYIFIGDPSGIDLKDQTSFDVGVSYDFTSELTGSFAYEQSTALVSGGQDPEAISLGLNYKFNETFRAFGGLAFGLSDASPDQRITIGVGIAF